MEDIDKLMSDYPQFSYKYESMPKGIDGINIGNEIIINSEISKEEQLQWLYEEIGHAMTSEGDITDCGDRNNMRQEYEARIGRSARTSFVILDAQSIKNTATAENKGYDGGKKISGIKRHLAVDINGFPQAIHITRANITDRDGAIALVTLNLEQFKLVRTMMVDSGYTGQNFANEISSLTSAKVIVVKRNELHQFSVIPQRWLIERSFSWLGNYHRLWRNCERKLNTSLMMVSLLCQWAKQLC
uniref:IS5 family transposase n=1 Tax=Lentilactobacillus hilgardii TaxID=1588 RepID=UPI00403F0154